MCEGGGGDSNNPHETNDGVFNFQELVSSPGMHRDSSMEPRIGISKDRREVRSSQLFESPPATYFGLRAPFLALKIDQLRKKQGAHLTLD